jgi:Leucine-rich repeat (LRR) protein
MEDACLYGPVPSELGALVLTTDADGDAVGGLVNLDLSQNRLTSSIPVECAALTLLTMWDVEDNVKMDSCNPLAPTVPTDFTSTTIGGPCPGAAAANAPCSSGIATDSSFTACVAAPATCTDLNLAGLSLSCTIPTEIGLLTALTNLDLGQNNLTGQLPTELGLLTNVVDLVAGDQCLSGTVPTELGAMASLTNIDMEDACLYGPVPSELGALVAGTNGGGLVNLDLSQNRLTGSIPSECAALTLLTMWDVEDNVGMNACNPLLVTVPVDFSATTIGGPCPGGAAASGPCANSIETDADYIACLAAPATCTELNLAGLSLSCTIPTEIGLLTALTDLDLGDNDLTGPLPTELGLLTSVINFNAFDQCLTGTVPTEMGAMISLTNIDIQNACLTGPVPSELGELDDLMNLDLAKNRLTGSIPVELADVGPLRRFDVADNVAMDSCNPLAVAVVTDFASTSIQGPCVAGPPTTAGPTAAGPGLGPAACSTAIATDASYTACVAAPAGCTDL